MNAALRSIVAILLAASFACAQPELLRDGAQVAYEDAAEIDLKQARAHAAQGEPKLAREVLERFVSELPRSQRMAEALFLLGSVNEQLGERERAAATWRRLVEHHPSSRFAPESALRAAQIYRDLGRLETGRRMLAGARFDGGDAEIRIRMHLLQAELARGLNDYPGAVLSLSLARREIADAEQLREIDLELEELIESRLQEDELSALVTELPRGPVYDRVNLVLAARLLSRGERDAAREILARLPQLLRPADDEQRQRLVSRLERGQGNVAETLGVALPLSGPYAPFGRSVLRGVVLALGLFDDPEARFRLIVRDTAGERRRGEQAVRELIDAGVSGIIGPLRSVVAEAVAPIAEEAAVPLLTLAKREDIALLGDYVFRLGLSATDEARALARYSTQVAGHRRFAILYPDDAYGRNFKDLFWDAVEEQGGVVVGSESYDPDAVDWQDEIKKLVGMYYLTRDEEARVRERNKLSKRPDKNAAALASSRLAGLPPYVDFQALFIADDAAKVGLILPQLRFHDVRDVTYLGGSAWNDPDLVRIAGREARDAVFVDAFHPDSTLPRVARFVAHYTETYGDRPDALSAEGYDAGLLFRDIIGSRGGLTREDLRKALHDLRDFQGVSGVTEFDETGGTRKEVHFLTVRKGEIQTLEPLP